MERRLISLQEASKLCNYTQEYLSLRARKGKLRAEKIGRNWLTTKEWLQEYIDHTEEWKNNGGNGRNGNGVHDEVAPEPSKGFSPPENLPIEKIYLPQIPSHALSGVGSAADVLKNIASLVTASLVVLSGAAVGEKNLQEVHDDISYTVETTAQSLSVGAEVFAEETASKLESILDPIVAYAVQGSSGILDPISKEIEGAWHEFDVIAKNFAEGFSIVEDAIQEHAEYGAGQVVQGTYTLGARIDEQFPVLAPVGDWSFKYWNWLSQNLRGSYIAANNALEEGIDRDTRTFSELNEKISKLDSQLEQGFVRDTQFVKEHVQTLGRSISSAGNSVFAVGSVISRISSVLTDGVEYVIEKGIDSLGKIGQFAISPWQGQKSEEDKEIVVEKIQKEEITKEIIKEITKEVEVSRVTKVEPIREITREVITVDSAQLAQVKADFAKVLSWRGEIDALSFLYSSSKIQSNPPQYTAVTAPVYIGSSGIQVGGNGNFASLGVSGEAGVSTLGVGKSAVIGEVNKSDSKLTVNAITTFNSAVTVSSNLTLSGDATILGNVTLGDSVADTLTINATVATIANNLNIDDSTLFIDSANNRVGIRTITPAYTLDVTGTLRVTGDVIFNSSLSVGTAGGILQLADGTATSPSLTFFNDTDTGIYRIGANSIGIITGGSATQGITIDSSGSIGIGDITPDALLDLDSSATTGNIFGILSTTLTTGEIADITATYAPTDGSDNEALDINLTYTPTTTAGTFRGLDLNVTEGVNALANTDYGIKTTVDNSANTSTGTHSIYGGHFTVAGKTAGTTTAVGLYATASGADNNYAAIFESGSVGIADTSPDAKLDIDSSSTAGADFLITNTGVGISGTVAAITANSYTAGDIFSINGTGLTTGTALTLIGPSSTGVTDHFIKATADVGSASSLLNLNPDFSGSGVTGYGIYNIATDSTGNANTDYGYYGSLAFTGNANKTGVGFYSTVTTASTTADTIIAADLATSDTGVIASGTRTIYGLRTQPASAAASSGGTLTMYGFYSVPSSTLIAGATVNVYGGYIGSTATVASGTINSYGLYIANPAMNTTGTSTKYGLYVEDVTASAADTNYAAIFAGGNVGIGNTTPTYALDISGSARASGSFLGAYRAEKILSHLDATTNWSSPGDGFTGITTDTSEKKEGSASLSGTSDNINSVPRQISSSNSFGNLSEFSNDDDYLEFWLYVSNASLLQTGSNYTVELGNTQDTVEYQWDTAVSTLSTGWNKVFLRLGSATKTGTVTWTSVSYFRFFLNGNGNSTSYTVKLDDLKLVSNRRAVTYQDLALENNFNVMGNVGIGDTSPDAKLDIDSSATTGNIFGILSTTLTTGEIADITATYAPTDGSTNEALDINITHSPTGSADNFQSLNLTTTDGTALGNTVYNQQNTLTLTGNAAKTGIGVYSTVTSSSTTGDTLVGVDIAASATGALSATQTRTVYGLRSQPASTAATGNADDTLNLYGSYLAPSSTLATAGTTNVYGQYITTTATHAADVGTVNQYGLYIADGTSSTSGTASKYGIYIAPQTGADSGSNIGLCFDCDGTWTSSTVAAGIQFGTDANAVSLYRSASDTLRTGDNLTVDLDLTVTGGDITGANGEGMDIGEAANGTISLLIDGTSGLNIGSTGISSIGNVAHTIVDSSGALNIDSNSTGAINIGTGANAKTITIGNNTTSTALAFTSGTGSQTFTSSVVTGSSTTSGFVFDATAISSGTGFYLTTDSVTTGRLLDIATTGNTWTGNGTTSGLVNLASTSTAGTVSGSDIILNIARSGANANTAHTAYGIYSTVTNTNVTSGTNVAGYFSATGATTANTAISIGDISTAAATNTGILLGTMTGGTTSNYQISTGVLTSATTTTNAQLNLGGVVTTGGTTNYGINVGALSGSGTTNYGINIATLTSTGTVSTALNIGGLSGAATTNNGIAIGNLSGGTTSNGITIGTNSSATTVGLSIGALSGSTANRGISISTITAAATANNFSIDIGAITPQALATVASINTSGIAAGAGTATYGIKLGTNASTATTNTGIDIGALSGAGTTNYGLNIGNLSGATTSKGIVIGTNSSVTATGLDIGALSGTTANTGINIGAISGALGTGAGITVGNISTTGTTNYGLQLGTMTGGTTSNYQISTGVLTSATTTTNAQLNLGGVVTTGGTTNYGINVGALSGSGTTNYGANISTLTSTGTTNYGLNIGGATGAATTNYGLVVGTVSGATTNYGVLLQGTWMTGGTATTTKPQLLIEPSGTTSTAWSTSGTGLGINSAQTFAGNLLDIQQASKSVFSVAGVSTAVNGFVFSTAATGNGVTIAAGGAGSDTNIALSIDPKGTGALNLGTSASARTITIGNNTTSTALAFTSGTGSQTFTSSVATGTTTTGAWVLTGNSLTSGTGLYTSSSSLTQGKLAQLSTGSANTLTTGTIFDVRSTATSLTGAAGTGSFVNIDWSPGSATTATGDLWALNIGTNGTTTGKLFNILDASSSIFSVSETAVTTSLPANFTASGDVSIAYDLQFTNQTASYIKSDGPLYIQSGEVFENNDLTLVTFGTGAVAVAQSLATTGSPTAFRVDGAAHTTLTASTEAIDINFNLARTVQFATGALTTQRAVQISAPTYGFVGASTLSTAATFDIGAAPSAGTNATITSASALRVGATGTSLATVAGLNYQAISVPAQTLTVTGTTQVTSSTTAAVGIGQLTITDASVVTYDNASSLYIAAAPVAAGSVTLTNAYALWVDAGAARFDGPVAFGAQQTLTVDSTTPSVSGGSHFITANVTSPTLISNFTNGKSGQILIVELGDAATDFDCTASNLNCGGADITAGAAGDVFTFVYDGTNWNLINWMDTSATQTGADIAEWYFSQEALEAGDVVAVDATQSAAVKKSQSAYESDVMGVVSTTPGIILGEQQQQTFPVALAGRVPMKVSVENGPIEVGDFLTSSSVPGVGMKATGAGRVIGMALESYDGITESNKILIFVNPHWMGNDLSVVQNEQGKLVNLDPEDLRSGLLELGLAVNSNGVLEVDTLRARKVAAKFIELVDQQTGLLYCTWIQNGEWVKVQGECDTIQIGNDQTSMTNDQSSSNVPVEESSAEKETSAEELPAEETSVDKSVSVEESPAEEPSVAEEESVQAEEPPAEESSAEKETSAEELPVEEFPAEETSVDKSVSVEESSHDKVSTEEPPAEEESAPAEEVLAEELITPTE